MTNSVDNELMSHLLRRHIALDKELREARDKRRQFRNEIKSYGVKLKNFDIVFRLWNENNDDAPEFIDDLREQRRLMQIAGLPVGHQFSLLGDEAPTEAIKITPFQRGARAYIDGLDEAENPHSVNTREGQDWLEGYRHSVTQCTAGADKAAAFVADE